MIEPIIEYGLVKVNTTQKYRVVIENVCPIASEVIVKNSKNKRLSF